MMIKKKIAVIGAGISGISIASILQDDYDVQVFERSPYIGGLVHCDRSSDFLYHRVGGHVFNSKNKEILDWFWSKFDKDSEFIQAKRNAKIYYKGSFVGYPIENFLYQFDASLVEKIIAELIDINRSDSKDPMSYSDFETFLKGNFGSTLYELYFKPYNEKIWKTDLSAVSMDWLEGKLPMPRLLDILTSNINRQEEGEMVHSTFYYPRHGGSQFIAERLAENLTIHCNQPLESIQIKSAKQVLLGESFDSVIYTGDVRKLPDILNLEDAYECNEEIKNLRSNGTSSVLCECDANDLSWLYIPEPQFKAHRIIYTGNFSSTNNPKIRSCSSCTVEFSGICSFEEMKEELKVLPGNLTAIDFNQEPNSYVIQDHKTRKIIQGYKEYLSKLGIHLLGRFGEWEYYNMDKAMEAAFELKKSLMQKHNA
jgi:protoporphyrinogen oxidase